jgi:hypothetical protein
MLAMRSASSEICTARTKSGHAAIRTSQLSHVHLVHALVDQRLGHVLPFLYFLLQGFDVDGHENVFLLPAVSTAAQPAATNHPLLWCITM